MDVKFQFNLVPDVQKVRGGYSVTAWAASIFELPRPFPKTVKLNDFGDLQVNKRGHLIYVVKRLPERFNQKPF